MRVYPVIDLLEGVVVRAVAGERGRYRPIVSRLVAEPAPLAVARAFRSQLGLAALYLADLDAILHLRPNHQTYRELRDDQFKLMVDAGVRSEADVGAALEAGAEAAVVGLETWPGPTELSGVCRRFGPGRIVFSLDLRNGQPLSDNAAWGTAEPLEIAGQAFAAGVRRMIVLDLAGVGVNAGVNTLELCRRLRERHPDLELITGGGARTIEDIRLLAEANVDGALVASAFHDGRLTKEELRRLG